MKKKILLFSIIIILVLISILSYYGFFQGRKYTLSEFGIDTIKSMIDYNDNGIDDYTDILNGAKIDAKNKPKYKSEYYAGGYPPDSIGVCTDVIWRAFKNAGYSLKDMVDKDIKNNQNDYDIPVIDSNIDFRRVTNLRVFFDKYAQTLTNDINKIEEWMPGDIAIFGNNKHIGIVSNYRNKDGIAYIIHNGGQPIREENYLVRAKVTKHYRFDASKIDDNILFPWNE
ncbi:MAG: DUF1287 domain-containing protein [Bacilli bacterium]|nr:DUF1287 domain-containing protein [Bacilli bacterium]